jgi:hypothetical protein
MNPGYLTGALNYTLGNQQACQDPERINLISQERHIMLLIDEISRFANIDASENVFDLLKVVDSLTNTTRGQIQIKNA